jgi:hypothetical protein
MRQRQSSVTTDTQFPVMSIVAAAFGVAGGFAVAAGGCGALVNVEAATSATTKILVKDASPFTLEIDLREGRLGTAGHQHQRADRTTDVMHQGSRWRMVGCVRVKGEGIK